MTTCTVTFLPHERSIEVEPGQPLLRAALDAGVHVNASCGGEGVCGKCRIRIEQGRVDQGISSRLDAGDIEAGYRLACLAKVCEDVVVRIPVESAIDTSALNRRTAPRRKVPIKQVDFSSLKEKGLFVAPVEKIYLELPPPDIQNNIPDVSRLVTGLNQQAGLHRLELTLPVIRDLPAIMRKKDFKITVTVVKPVRDDGKNLIAKVQPGDTTDQSYAVAIDIGTTTVFGQLIDLNSGESIAEYGEFNGQISYGEDVISRIIYAEKDGGLKRLQEVVLKTINTILKRIIGQAKIDRGDIATITLAGNTTMTQLLLAIDPRHLRRAPYVPAATLFPPVSAAAIGLELCEQTIALLFPSVSSYVGGDIVAGVMGSGLYRDPEVTLFLDIGTNAEIVIGNQDWLVCAACSAGPAFEGGGIEFGMRASKGAIEDFSIDPISFEPMLLTIGDTRPKGICGSGLIIMIATLFETGVVNSRGKFNQELDTPRIRQRNDVWEYVLAWKEETQIDRDIVLTELDIDNLIRAKGAIFSGCQTLLAEVGFTMDMIERIIIGGGFGSYIDLEKAMTIGLLPEIDPDRVSFIGNSSLMGARMSALSNHIRQHVSEVTKKMTNFELSETTSYMDHYVAAMFLPHTDIDHFPRLKQRMAVLGR
jgi:uncharacterized 2Fe-2S/4Fe-4S cluster protein (DUF4445 family)